MSAIQFIHVTKSFGRGTHRATVLHDLSLEIRYGEIFGFIGPNGAGKSTSIKLLLNFLTPDAGQLTIGGLDVRRKQFRQLIGYLPETPCFYDNLTGRETLFFAARSAAMEKSCASENIKEILERVNLSRAADARVGTYSKGMKQRLGLATALIHDPEIYILDEPMSGLDPMGRNLVGKIIRDLKNRGKTVFFSTHILNDVEVMCDRVGILSSGSLIFAGAFDSLLRSGENLEEAFVHLIEQSTSSTP